MRDLKILANHPVQYQAPLFKALMSSGINIDVGYYHSGAARGTMRDEGFGLDFQWDIDLLDGYKYLFFLQNQPSYGLGEQLRLLPSILVWCVKDRQVPLLLVGWFAEVVWIVWLTCILVGVPVFVFGENTTRSFQSSPKAAWRVAFLRWLLRHTNACFYIGRRNKEFWESLGVDERQLFYTPYSIDNERFQYEFQKLVSMRDGLCERYGLDPKLPTFLFCGKLIPKKRPIELFNAFLASNSQGRAQLLYVGDGQLLPTLKQRVSTTGARNVHFIGFLNQSQIPLAYVLGHVLCLPSNVLETWGLVVNESFACGRPAIVTEAVGCVPDLVDELNGWVVEGNSIERLNDTLRRALECREDWDAMGRRAQQKVLAHSYQAMVSGMLQALAVLQHGHQVVD